MFLVKYRFIISNQLSNSAPGEPCCKLLHKTLSQHVLKSLVILRNSAGILKRNTCFNLYYHFYYVLKGTHLKHVFFEAYQKMVLMIFVASRFFWLKILS